MESTAQDELRARILAHLASGVDPMCDEVMRHPTDGYVSAGLLARERETIFSDYPLVIGSSDQVRKPGDFFTDDLSGRPLLVVRGDDGVLRALLNSCGHRGSKVETAPCGSSRRFTCPFHAWSYDRTGALRSIPNDEGFVGLDRDARGLAELPVEERHGLVWVRPSGKAPDVAAYLGTLDAELAGYGMDAYVHERAEVLRRPFNWKLVVDGFLESYHLRFLHRSTIGPYIRSNFALFDAHGPHAAMVALRSSFDADAQGRGEQELMPELAIIYLIFPNTVLVWQSDHFEAWSIFPDGAPDRMVARAALLAPTAPVTADETLHWDKNWKVLMDTVQQEDWAVAKTIQDNIAAGARPDAVFGRQEATLQHFHSHLTRAMR
jgi:phenylpropionate dioxygenase-like ring-hydroxylating dioxygenase large terminal subunit